MTPEARPHAVISGVGQSTIGRKIGRSAMALALEACLAAIEDAGLRPDDIDGVSTYPGRGAGYPGLSPEGVPEVQDALRLNLRWFAGAFEIPSSQGSIVNACAAVTAGLARHVLCFRAIYESSQQGQGSRADAMRNPVPLDSQPRLEGLDSWHSPLHCNGMNAYALVAQRYLYDFNVPREQFGQIALNGRRHAERNPKAVYRSPLSLDDYMDARMISSPLCLFDCDVPIDGATAVIVSHSSTSDDLRRRPIHIEALGTARQARVPFDQVTDMSTFPNTDAARMLWDNTELGVDDVDVGLIYDGFSIITVSWLEAFGFCGRGEAGLFVEAINRPSERPGLVINPHGGQLSEGRTHGYGFVHEAALQLWGEAGERQVPDRPSVALTCSGAMHGSTCMLLTV